MRHEDLGNMSAYSPKNPGFCCRYSATALGIHWFIPVFIVVIAPADSSHSPSNTVSAGPVIMTGAPAPAHATASVPPRVATHTGESSNPRRIPVDHRGTRAGTAREGLAGAPLPHAQANVSAIDDLHVTCVAPAEILMQLDQRSLASAPAPRRRPRSLDRVRIAQRHRGDERPCGPPTSRSDYGSLAPRKGFPRRESRRAHVDRHLAVRLQRGLDHATARFDADGATCRQPAPADELDETPRAVAALFDLAAVGVEYAIAKIDVRARRGLPPPGSGRSPRRNAGPRCAGSRPARARHARARRRTRRNRCRAPAFS